MTTTDPPCLCLASCCVIRWPISATSAACCARRDSSCRHARGGGVSSREDHPFPLSNARAMGSLHRCQDFFL
jgi:hypothetical protein